MARRKLRRLTIPLLPTMLTLANGICGLGAITLATNPALRIEQGMNGIGVTADAAFPGGESRLLLLAGLLVFLGMLFDMFDGQLARLTKQTSRFGAELDSLCDMITFGLAPVFIMLTFADIFPRRFLWGIGVLFTVSAVLRLARFNVEKDMSKATGFFKGLPTPAAAGTVASFAIALPALQRLAEGTMPEANQILGTRLITLSMAAVPILTLVLACLMVSPIKYPHIANQFLAGRRNFYQLVELVFAAVATLTLREIAVPLIFCYYVFSPLVNQLRVKALLRLQKSREAYATLAPSEEA